MKQLNKLFSALSLKTLMPLSLFALLPTMASAQCPDNNHPHMIDLGLPSGTKWACCNVGAEKPEDYGGYYAWGETEDKDSYGWSSYIHCDGSQETCHDIGSYIFNTQYDVAHIKWGGSWVMPTGDQLNELKANCTYEWVTENGVNGYRFTGPNGAYVFIPASGQRWSDGSLVFVGDSGYYWSSSLSDYQGGARALNFWNSFMDVSGWDRNFGNSVRPVAASLSIAIDQTNFPDENFRNYVLAQDYGQDGVLTEAEIAGMTVISVYGSNIADLKGIEYFTALMGLYCGSNQLTSLDVSQNTALTQLACFNNQLTSLDVSKNTALTYLSCDGNQLTTLDVSKNTALKELACAENQITTLDVSKNTALTYIYCINNQLKTLDVSKNTALHTLICMNNQLTSLVVSNNSALITLFCDGNQINETEMGKLVESLPANNGKFYVKYLNSSNEQNVITTTQVAAAKAKGWTVYAFDSSVGDNGDYVEYDGDAAGIPINSTTFPDENFRNWVLAQDYGQDGVLTDEEIAGVTEINVWWKNIADLKGVEYFTALTKLYCDCNQLTSLNVSQNTALKELYCNDNQLTSLNVSQNTALTWLDCSWNQISGAAMDALIAGLPSTEGTFRAFGTFEADDVSEQNVVTKAQVAAAKEKGWTTYCCVLSEPSTRWIKYEGSDPEIAPVDQGESIDIGIELDETTNLDGNVVGDVFYSISSGDGSYDPTEGCIVVTKPTDESAIEGKDIFGEDFKAGFTGIVFKVAPGSGTVKVEAQTQGNMVLKVKIGDNAPVEMELEGKLKVKFPYSVSEETLVYIYGGTSAAGAKGIRKAAGSDALKIYGIEVTSETDGIKDIKDEKLKMKDSPVYNLNGQQVEGQPMQKGVYIKNGKKVMVK